MTDTTEPDPSEWVWQGFYGPRDLVAAAMSDVYADARVGARVPLPEGEQTPAPLPVDEVGLDGMFAVMTRRNAAVPTPAGLRAARSDMVGRMVGA
jgi:hypothetical protein